MRMLLGLSEALPSLVEAKFKSAKATSSLLFSPTELAIVRTSTGIPFQLRYCPSLAKKPTPKHDTTPKIPFDPFANPPPTLHIADIPATNPSHQLVLNKFPIIAGHFILATKSNKQQAHALEQDDLEATYACLKAWQESSKQRRLFAFFNSGDHSGASQPHRHIQFLPLEGMRDGEVAEGWNLLIDHILEDGQDLGSGLLQHSDLPFTHFARKFAAEPSGAQLLGIYNELYQTANEAVDNFVRANPEQLSLYSVSDSDLPISYNLAVTTSGMAILPRRSEGTMLHRHDGSKIGFVALNGTTLGGTMMVKHEVEWDTLRLQPEMLDSILAGIGIPKEPLPFKSRA